MAGLSTTGFFREIQPQVGCYGTALGTQRRSPELLDSVTDPRLQARRYGKPLVHAGATEIRVLAIERRHDCQGTSQMLMLRSSRLPPQGPVLLHLPYASKRWTWSRCSRHSVSSVRKSKRPSWLERLARTREAVWSSTSLEDGPDEHAKEARPSPWPQEQAGGPSCGLVRFEARWTTTRAPTVHTRAP